MRQTDYKTSVPKALQTDDSDRSKDRQTRLKERQRKTDSRLKDRQTYRQADR